MASSPVVYDLTGESDGDVSSQQQTPRVYEGGSCEQRVLCALDRSRQLYQENGVIDLTSSDTADKAKASPIEIATTIPTTQQIRAGQHQTKPKNNPWPTRKSRKALDRKIRKTVLDAGRVYYAKTMQTLYLKDFIQLPHVQESLRAFRQGWQAPLSTGKMIYDDAVGTASTDSQESKGCLATGTDVTAPVDLPSSPPSEVIVRADSPEVNPIVHAVSLMEVNEIADPLWPKGVKTIRQRTYAEDLKGETIIFLDIGKVDSCECVGDCYRESCSNATLDIFCSRSNCRLHGHCSNTAYEYGGVELIRCEFSLGVCATQFIPAGAVIEEYTGELTMHDFEADTGLVEYALALQTTASTAKSRQKHKVYIDASVCGNITRFINHSCEANCMFVEVRNRRRVKVLVIVNVRILPQQEITVNYDDQLWFDCTCGLGSCPGATNI